ncbi:MarR family winged helix-turn-helix transcriptional regulator [Kutzneria sp. CA-103260]|uniref:MarR family winged helix-turn-helix transcriptional regulator n=1 Tax=Kutzneria sp. CA-103260 TaxID=2802641 RepID=UPI001BA804C4|nr:MarR family transcriptional regulator [Kutzneria sp. CA-103260]QUQ62322.1 MarR family transcriptional regulator [Kutzneria sp. CA-103260]
MDDNELAVEVREAVSRLARRLRQERPPHELGLTSLSALSRLYRLGPASPSALAAAENVQPQSMTRALATLTERGLVVREPHPTDGRQTLVTITDAGRAVLEQDRSQRDAWLADVIADRLTPIEQEFLRAAAKLLEVLAT